MDLEKFDFLDAVRNLSDHEEIKKIAEEGADIHAVNDVGSDAFQEAVYGDKFENLSLIHELGHRVEEHGGQAFRDIIGCLRDDPSNQKNLRQKHLRKAAEFFLANGVEINYNKPDQVYSYKETPLCVAAQFAGLETCKMLVNHGADVTISDKGGMRPYTIALKKGDFEMAAYFKALEPAELHSQENMLKLLKSFKLSEPLKDFLCGENLYFRCADSDVQFVEFFNIVDTVPFEINKQKLLRISKKMGNYDFLDICWHPKKQRIIFYDNAHEELKNPISFENFIADVGGYVQKVIDGTA